VGCVARGATLVMHYEADVFPGGLTVSSRDPDPTTTAYGMLADPSRDRRSRREVPVITNHREHV
jgi:hypothetical protein